MLLRLFCRWRTMVALTEVSVMLRLKKNSTFVSDIFVFLKTITETELRRQTPQTLRLFVPPSLCRKCFVLGTAAFVWPARHLSSEEDEELYST